MGPYTVSFKIKWDVDLNGIWDEMGGWQDGPLEVHR
jgi:hypothetical protein